MKKSLIFLALIIAFAGWFSLLIPWNLIPDPDAFYHITMALRTWRFGPVLSFSWLDLTSLGAHFADQHFLFHILQIPFLWFFNPLTASRISSISFAVLALTGITFIFYCLRLSPFWLWPLLLAASQPFATRMVQGKASPLVILIWLIGLVAALYLITQPKTVYDVKEQSLRGVRRRENLAIKLYLILFLSGLLFALTHGGWIILLLSVALLLAGNLLSDISLKNFSFYHGLKNIRWHILITPLLGIITGILLHPGRKELLTLLWVQVFKVAIAAPSTVYLGMEWSGASLTDSIAIFSVFGVILILVIPGLIIARRDRINLTLGNESLITQLPNSIRAEPLGGANFQIPTITLMSQIVIWGILVSALFALSLKAVRFAEYFQPALAIWTAMLAQLVDWKKLLKELSVGSTRFMPYLIKIMLFIVFFSVIFNSGWTAFTSLHNAGKFFDYQYQIPMQAIIQKAQPGDRVYHVAWDEFPILFYYNQNLKYVSGLDPTFLYEASSTLSDNYSSLMMRPASSTRAQVWSFIHDQIHASYIVLDTSRWNKLAALIATDPRYQKIAEGNGGAAFKVVDVPFGKGD